MAIDETKLNEFLGQFVADLGATMNAPLSCWATSSGCTRAWPTAGRRRLPSWPRAPAPPSATCGSGCWPRPPAATSPTTATTRSST